MKRRDLLHASMTCRRLHEAVTGDRRLRGIMLHSARVAAMCFSEDDEDDGEAWRRGALCLREWGIDPVDFASAAVQLLPRSYRMERDALWLLHVSFEAVVIMILEVCLSRPLLGDAAGPVPPGPRDRLPVQYPTHTCRPQREPAPVPLGWGGLLGAFGCGPGGAPPVPRA
jgi:hypothetical protein